MIKTFTITFASLFYADCEARGFVGDLKSKCEALNLGMKWDVLYWNLPLIRSSWAKVEAIVEGEEQNVSSLGSWIKNYKKNEKDPYYDKYGESSLKSGYVERK